MSGGIKKGTRLHAVLRAIANGAESCRDIAYATDGTKQQTRSALSRLSALGLVSVHIHPEDDWRRTYAATIDGLAALNMPEPKVTKPPPRGFKGEIVRAVMSHGYTSPTKVGRLAGCSARYVAMVRDTVEDEKAAMLRKLEDAEIAGQGIVPLDDVCETMADIYVCRILASEGSVVIVDQHVAMSPLRFSAAARRVTA